MDIVDRDLEKAERGASPNRFPKSPEEEEYEPPLSPGSESSGSRTQVRPNGGMSRMPTERDRDFDLERSETALSRIQTGRTQHSHTVGATSKSRQCKKPLPSFGGGKEYPPLLPDREEYVVEFDGEHDPLHPQNWPIKKKLYISFLTGFFTLSSAFGSSIFSAATASVAKHFHVGTEVGVLGVSLFVLGFATGPIIWAPWSELYGRKQPLAVASFAFGVFCIGTAAGKDLQTVLICRFWSGFFGACPLTIVGAIYSDMFDNRTRGVAVTGFSMAVFSGPMLAPFIGGFIVMNPHMGWRWTAYITAIMGFLSSLLIILFFKETYAPVVLVEKASELRRRTKNWGIHAKQEEIEVDLRELFQKNFSRPLRMLVTEPIVLLISLYMAFIYGLLYLLLTAYPIVFQKIHGFNLGVGGLPFIGIIVGELVGGTLIILRQPSYQRKLVANNNVTVPEWRLQEAIFGGISFAGGLFWFSWGGYKADVHWIVPTLAGILIGAGLLTIFLQCLNYLIDAYLMFAASAIAANTFLRSLFGAAFPLFATYMYEGMGVQWAGTLLGLLALCMVPVSTYFYYRGGKIREKSKFAPTAPMGKKE